MPEDSKIEFRIPDYVSSIAKLVKDFFENKLSDHEKENKKMEILNFIETKFNLKNDVESFITGVMCYLTDQDLMPLKFEKLVNFFQRWIDSGEAKQIKNFPVTAISLNNTLQITIDHLKERNLLVEQLDENDENVLIFKDIVYQNVEEKTISKIFELVSNENLKIYKDSKQPFFFLKSVMFYYKITVNDIVILDPLQNVSEEELLNLESQKKIIGIKTLSLSENDIVVFTPEYFKKFLYIAFNKIKNFFNKLIEEKTNKVYENPIVIQLNNRLKTNFQGEKITLQALLNALPVNNEIWTKEAKDLTYWIAVFNELNNNILVKWTVPDNEQKSIILSANVLSRYILKLRDIQLEEEKLKKLKDSIYKKIFDSEFIKKSEFYKIAEKALKTDDKKDEKLNDKIEEFYRIFLNEYSIEKNSNSFIIELPIFSDKDCYLVFSTFFVKLFNKYLNDAKNNSGGIKNIAFLNHINSIISFGEWNDEVMKALENEYNFSKYVINYIVEHYPILYSFYIFIEKNIDTFKFLLMNDNEKLINYFNENGSLKTLDQFLNLSRIAILKEIKNRRSIIDIIIDFFTSILPITKNKAKKKLLKIISKELRKEKRDYNKNVIDNNLIDKDEEKDGEKEKKMGKLEIQIIKDKIKNYKEKLLKLGGAKEEKEFMNKYLKKWTLNPEDDEMFINEMLKEKPKNSRMSRIKLICKDINTMKSFEEFLAYVENMAKDIVKQSNKKHIRLEYLTYYLAMKILIVKENNLR